MSVGQNWGVSFRINTTALGTLASQAEKIATATSNLKKFGDEANRQLGGLVDTLGKLKLTATAKEVEKIAAAARGAGGGSGGSGGLGFNTANIGRQSTAGGRPENIANALGRYLGIPQNEFGKLYGKQVPTVGRNGSLDANQAMATILYSRVTSPLLGALKEIGRGGAGGKAHDFDYTRFGQEMTTHVTMPISGKLDRVIELLSRGGGSGGNTNGPDRGGGNGGPQQPRQPTTPIYPSVASARAAGVQASIGNAAIMAASRAVEDQVRRSRVSATPGRAERDYSKLEDKIVASMLKVQENIRSLNETVRSLRERQQVNDSPKLQQELSRVVTQLGDNERKYAAALAKLAKVETRAGGTYLSDLQGKSREGNTAVSGTTVNRGFNGTARSVPSSADAAIQREQGKQHNNYLDIIRSMPQSAKMLGPIAGLSVDRSRITDKMRNMIASKTDDLWKIAEGGGRGRSGVFNQDRARALLSDNDLMNQISRAMGATDIGKQIRNKPGTKSNDKIESQMARIVYSISLIKEAMQDVDAKVSASMMQETANQTDARRSRRRNPPAGPTTLGMSTSVGRRGVGRNASRMGMRSMGTVSDSEVDEFQEGRDYRPIRPLLSGRNRFTSQEQWHGALSRVVNWGSAATFAYGGTQQIKSGIDLMSKYERALMDVRRVASPLGFDISKVSQSAQELGRTFGVSITEAAKAMSIFAQQGMDMQGVIDSTRASMVLSNTTEMNLVEATEALTATQRQFQISTAQSMRIVDAWTSVANVTAVSANTLGDAMRLAGTSMRVAGIDFDRANGIIAAVGESTRKSGEEIGTSMKFIFQHLREDQAVESLQQIGIYTEDSAGKMKSAKSVIDELSRQWDHLTASQQQQIAVSIAGTRHLNDFFVLMDTWQRSADITTASMSSQGTSMKQNAMLMETLEKQVGQLKAAYEGLWVALGNSGVLTTVKSLVSLMTQLLEGFGKVNSIGLGVPAAAVATFAGYKTAQIGSQVLGDAVLPALFSEGATLTPQGRRRAMQMRERSGRGFVTPPNTFGMSIEAEIARSLHDDLVYDREAPRERKTSRFRNAGIGLMGAGIAVRGVYDQFSNRQPGDAMTGDGLATDITSTSLQTLGMIGLLRPQGGFKNNKASGLMAALTALAGTAKVVSSISDFSKSSGPTSSTDLQAQIDGIRGQQEKLSTTRALIQEQVRRGSTGGDIDLDVFADIKDQMSVLAPEMKLAADGTGGLVGNMRQWIDTIKEADDKLRGRQAGLSGQIASRTEGGEEFQNARQLLESTAKLIEQNRNRGEAGLADNYTLLAQRSGARRTLSDAFRNRMVEASDAAMTGGGLDISSVRLQKLGNDYSQSPELIGRQLLRSFVNSLGRGDVEIDKQLKGRSVSEIQYVQLDKNGPVRSLRDGTTEDPRNVNPNSIIRTEDALFGNAAPRLKTQNLGKLMTEFERAVEQLINKNNRLIASMEASSQAIASRTYGQNYTGTTTGFNLINREAKAMMGIERGGLQGIPGIGQGNATDIGGDIIRMTGQLTAGGANGNGVSMRGIMDILARAQEFETDTLTDARKKGSVFVRNGGKAFSDDATPEDIEKAGGETATIRALKKLLDSDALTRLSQLATTRSTIEKGDAPDRDQRIAQIDAQADDIVAGSVKARTRQLRDTGGEYLNRNLERFQNFTERSIQELARGFQLASISNPSLTTGQYVAGPQGRQVRGNLQGMTNELEAVVQAATRNRDSISDKGSSQYREADAFVTLATERFRTLADATKNLTDYTYNAGRGLIDLSNSVDRATALSGLGSGFGQTGTAGQSFSADMFRQFAQDFLSQAEQAGNEQRALQLRAAAEQLKARADAADFQADLSRDIQKSLIKGLPAQYLANRATAAIGLGVGGTGEELKASITDSIQSSLQMMAMNFAEGREVTAATGNQFLQSMQPQLQRLTTIVQDMRLNQSPEYQKNYLLASPSQQLMADSIRQQMDAGATSDEIFADPFLRDAARNNPLVGNLLDQSIQRDSAAQMLDLAGKSDDKLGQTVSILQEILNAVNGDRAGRGLAPLDRSALPFAGGSMNPNTPAGRAAVDTHGRIREDGTPAILHKGEVVLNKRQTEALFQNKFAKGTLPPGVSKMLDDAFEKFDAAEANKTVTGGGIKVPTTLQQALNLPSGYTWNQVMGRGAQSVDLAGNKDLFGNMLNLVKGDRSVAQKLGIPEDVWSKIVSQGIISQDPRSSGHLNEAFHPYVADVRGKVKFSGRRGMNLATTFGGDLAAQQKAMLGILGHEGTHISDFILNPKSAAVGGRGIAGLQRDVLLAMAQRAISDETSIGGVVKGRVQTGYKSIFRNTPKRQISANTKDLFGIVAEHRSAYNELAAGDVIKLGTVDQKINEVLARASTTMMEDGISSTKYKSVMKGALTEVLGMLQDEGHDGSNIARMKFGELEEIFRQGGRSVSASASVTPSNVVRAAGRRVSLNQLPVNVDPIQRILTESALSRAQSVRTGGIGSPFLNDLDLIATIGDDNSIPLSNTITRGRGVSTGLRVAASNNPYDFLQRNRISLPKPTKPRRGLIYEFAGHGLGTSDLANPLIKIEEARARGLPTRATYQRSIPRSLTGAEKLASLNPTLGRPNEIRRITNPLFQIEQLRGVRRGQPLPLREAGVFTPQGPVYGPQARAPEIIPFGETGDPFGIPDRPMMFRPGAMAPAMVAQQGFLSRLGTGVGEVQGFSRPSLSGVSVRGAVGGLGRGLLGSKAAVANTAFTFANMYGEQVADRYGYGRQYSDYAAPAFAGANTLLSQQLLARTGSLTGLQILPRAFATGGMQGTARSMIGGSQIAGRALGPIAVADLTTRAGEILGNATGSRGITDASIGVRRLMYAPVTVPYEIASRNLGNAVNYFQGNGFTSDAQKRNDEFNAGAALLSQNDRSQWDTSEYFNPMSYLVRSNATVPAFLNDDIDRMTRDLQQDSLNMKGMFEDSVGRALLQQPIAKWGVSAIKGVTQAGSQSKSGSAALRDGLNNLPEELRNRILMNLDPDDPSFPVKARRMQLSYEQGKIKEALEQYRKYAAGIPAGYDSGQGTIISDLMREYSGRSIQIKEIDGLQSGYRANGIMDLKSVEGAATSNMNNVGDFTSPIIMGDRSGESWADFYMKMQGLDDSTAREVMATGSRNSMQAIKDRLGLDFNLDQWAAIGAGLPRTATLIDMINAASGKSFKDSQDAWLWLKENRGAFGGNAAQSARGRIMRQGSVTDLSKSNSYQRALSEGVTGNEFDRIFEEFSKSSDFELYESSYGTVMGSVASLLNNVRYDYRQTGTDVTGQRKRIAEAMKAIGPINEAFAAAQGAYGRINAYPPKLQELFASNPELAVRRNLPFGSNVDWFGVANRERPNDISGLSAQISRVNQWMARAQSDLGAFTGINEGRDSLKRTGTMLGKSRVPAPLRLRSVRALDDDGNPILNANGRPTFVTEARSPDGQGWFNAKDTQTAIATVREERLRVGRIESDAKATLGRLNAAANSKGRPMDGGQFLNLIRDPSLREQMVQYEATRFNLRSQTGSTAQDELARVNYQRGLDDIAIKSGYGRDFFEKAADAYDKMIQRQSEEAIKKAAITARVTAAKSQRQAEPYVGYSKDRLGLPGYATGTYAQRGTGLIDNSGLVRQDHMAVIHAKERVYPQEVSEGIDHLLELMRGLGNGAAIQSYQRADTMATDAGQFMGGYTQQDVGQRHVHEGTIGVTLQDDGVIEALAERILKRMQENSGGGQLRQGESYPTWYEKKG